MKKINNSVIVIVIIMVSLTGCWEADHSVEGTWILPQVGRFTLDGIKCEVNIGGESNPGIECENTNDVEAYVKVANMDSKFAIFDRTTLPLLPGEVDGNPKAEMQLNDQICLGIWRFTSYIDYLINQTEPDGYACYTVTEGDMPVIGQERLTQPFDMVLPVIYGAECHLTGHYDPKTWEQYDRLASCTKNQYSIDVRFPKYNNIGTQNQPIYSISYFLTEEPFEIGALENRDEATYSESVTSTSVYGIEVCRYSVTEAVDHWHISDYYICAARAFTIDLEGQTYDLVPGRIEGYSNDNTAPIE